MEQNEENKIKLEDKLAEFYKRNNKKIYIFVCIIIVIIALPLMDITDKWTRKLVTLMDVVDKSTRKALESSFKWIQRKNLKILSAFLLMIFLGILAQVGIIPKLIT